MNKNIEKAKNILSENSMVLYGIFGQVKSSGIFPTRLLLNEFLRVGYDPCDQDDRMASWPPFELSAEEYLEVKKWWASLYPNTIEDALGKILWQDWSF